MSEQKSTLKCPSCHEWYDEGGRTPKETPCRHTVCAFCVMKLLGEPLHASVNQDPFIPQGRIFYCHVCHMEVRTDAVSTNRAIASKISAMIGLEALITTDPEVPTYPKPPGKRPAQLKPKQPQPPGQPPSAPQPPEQLPSAPQPRPQPDAQAIGWTMPTQPPPPETFVPQVGGGEPQYGWSHAVPPPQGGNINAFSNTSFMPLPQNMPQLQGGFNQYPPSGDHYPPSGDQHLRSAGFQQNLGFHQN